MNLNEKKSVQDLELQLQRLKQEDERLGVKVERAQSEMKIVLKSVEERRRAIQEQQVALRQEIDQDPETLQDIEKKRFLRRARIQR
jgi:multidrug resistance efflux pump